MELASVDKLRKQSCIRISWAILFIKAFCIVARERPVFRQLYFPFPVAQIYQHSHSVAMMAIHREFQNESWLFWGRFIAPEGASLEQLQAILTRYQEQPVERVFRQQLQLSGLPTPIRRMFWWWNLNVSGKKRARRTGTCFLSTLAAQGAEIQSPPAFLTSNFTYGPMDERGRSRVTVSYDHRLTDGREVAFAMRDLETVLHGQLSDELRSLNTDSVRAA